MKKLKKAEAIEIVKKGKRNLFSRKRIQLSLILLCGGKCYGIKDYNDEDYIKLLKAIKMRYKSNPSNVYVFYTTKSNDEKESLCDTYYENTQNILLNTCVNLCEQIDSNYKENKIVVVTDHSINSFARIIEYMHKRIRDKLGLKMAIIDIYLMRWNNKYTMHKKQIRELL